MKISSISNFVLQFHSQYNIMLMSTKVCIKCAGRLHQLFDFNLLKSNIDMNRNPDSILGEECQFCNGTDVMRGMNFIGKVKEAIVETKWFEVRIPFNRFQTCSDLVIYHF